MDRKPLAPVVESMDPHSIRYTPSDWKRISAAARRRMEEPSRFARRLTMYALSIVEAQDAAPAHIGIPGVGRL